MQTLKTGARVCAAMLVALALSAAPAAAQSRTGCSLSGAVGGTVAHTAIGFGGPSLDGLSQQGLAARAGGRCALHLQKSPFVLLAGADYTWQNPEVSLGGFKAGLDESWTAYGGLGFAVGNVMPFIIGGYTETEWSTNFGIPTSTLQGWTAGGGFDWSITPQFSMGPEYRYTKYDGQGIGPVSLDTEQHSLMLVGRFNLSEMFK